MRPHTPVSRGVGNEFQKEATVNMGLEVGV